MHILFHRDEKLLRNIEGDFFFSVNYSGYNQLFLGFDVARLCTNLRNPIDGELRKRFEIKSTSNQTKICISIGITFSSLEIFFEGILFFRYQINNNSILISYSLF